MPKVIEDFDLHAFRRIFAFILSVILDAAILEVKTARRHLCKIFEMFHKFSYVK